MTEAETMNPRARPCGPVGLAFSLAGIGVLAVLLLALALAAAAGIDALVNGTGHLSGVFGSLSDLSGRLSDPTGRRADDVLMAVFSLGSAVYLAAALAILLVARWRGGADWRELLGWRSFTTDGGYWTRVAGAVAYGLLAGFVVLKLNPEAKDWLVLPRGGIALLSIFVLAVVMAPLAEELLFRGWIYTSLRVRLGAGATIGITGVLFALAHWERTHLYALAVLPVGLLLGYARERSGSVRATILMHGIYNCSALVAKILFPD